MGHPHGHSGTLRDVNTGRGIDWTGAVAEFTLHEFTRL